ncbi:MAG: hypothetical protein IKJ97_02650 [Bacteroidaceae bacterium]|nr:hypothetical protein [Bacteroidaceae bacterium]
MKKNLFLAGALALFAVVGVSAQNWSRTLATGLPGKEITHDVNGTSVTQYRAETALFEKAGATGVRYTVVQTTQANGIYGGGPFFAMGEIVVLGAEGDTIQYTATSNADHNSGGAGADGAGLPALNDGNLNNFFHSSWGGTEPGGLHYLELTFAEPVDAFQLVWYTRPNQHVNRPTVVGLTEPGVDFTEDMLFAEYEFEAGAKVTDAAEFANGGTFTLYVDGQAEFKDNEGNDLTGPGSIFVSLSGYETGANAEAGPTTIVQLIPGRDGKFVLYQPVSATYYGNADKWTDGFNGSNGWQRATDDATRLGEFEFTKRPDGDFEITTELTRQYVDGAWVEFDEPLKVWVGYRWDGKLKLATADDKAILEQNDLASGTIHYPVDFGFTIYNASVSKEMVPDKTAAEMCAEVLENIMKVAEDKQEEYADVIAEYDWEGAADELATALDAANGALTNGNLAGAFEAKSNLEAALAMLVAQKANYYEELHGELSAEVEENLATPPYTQDMTGMYTQASVDLLAQVKVLFDNAMKYEEYSYSQIEAMYAQIESLLDQLEGTKLAFTDFPEIVEDIPADNFPYSDLPNNAVWKRNVVLAQKTNGIRLTFLDRHIGSAGDAGNFPMIALGELKIYDADGNEVTMAAENFEANYTETQEGFESTVARLCDGNFGAQGYYHSPWSGNEPQEYIYIDITFPEEMDNFTFEVYSRDKTTSQGKVSLFPKKVAITEVGEAYDPLLFVENPYNVYVGEKVTSVDQITADGLYVIKGLLNTQKVWKEVTEGEGEEAVTIIKEVEPQGTAMFYHGTDRFHAADAAVRAQGVYRFVPNGDGTFKALSLGLGKYWPSTEETGFVGDKSTFEADKAAKLNIVASTNVEGAFLMYEKIEGLTTQADSIDTDEDGVLDAAGTLYQTPYVMFMDWANSLATRPVTDPQPVETSAELADNWGDAQCFNKENGEAEWEIYKVSMDNPDFFYLSNLTGAYDKLGLVVGTDPGCVSDLGALEAVLAEGQRVVADSVYADAPAAAAALAKEIAAVNSLEKNPMAEGVYQVVSANPDFKAKQNVEKALYAHVTEDGTATFGWKTIEQDNIDFYFHFTKSENGADLEEGETIEEGQGDLVYNIRAIATYEPETPYYIGEIDAQSTPVELYADAYSDYLVLNATGSAFTFRLAGKGAGMSIHANQHGGGTGQEGNIVYWDGGAGASQWYLRKVDYETSIDDFVAEGTEAVAVSYFTPSGAAVPAPVKGINIVVTVYANGVVETKKVLVK